VSDAIQAKRFFVSGLVQGVGFRFFAQHTAEKLRLGGYVRNLMDGRVEVYAIGTPEQLATLRAALEKGPRFSGVECVQDQDAELESRFENRFAIATDA
jgi:acylphosphatase